MHSFRFLLAMSALATTATALADPPTGSRLGDRLIHPGVAMTDKDVAVASQQMGQCLYERHRDVAVALLSTSDAAYAEKLFHQLAGEVTCFDMIPSNEMVDSRIVSFPQDVLRGMLAETALQRSRDEVTKLEPLTLEQKRYLRPWFVATGRDSAVDEMGACIADTNPTGIMGLIATEPKSPQEAQAFAGLGDSLGKCLSAGTTLHATPQALRAALADALYQRVRDPALSLPPPPKTESTQ